jgi:hypothetical protein
MGKPQVRTWYPKPLNDARNEIRLLQLKDLAMNTDSSYNIHGTLIKVSLDEDIHFTALSYEWSPPRLKGLETPKYTLIIDGKQFLDGISQLSSTDVGISGKNCCG